MSLVPLPLCVPKLQKNWATYNWAWIISFLEGLELDRRELLVP
jgi:hypothetical protein